MYKSGVKVRITKEERGYGAHAIIRNVPVNSYGKSMDELQTSFVDAINVKLGDTEGSYRKEDIDFTIDFRSFFEYYRSYHQSTSESDDWDAMETLGAAY